ARHPGRRPSQILEELVEDLRRLIAFEGDRVSECRCDRHCSAERGVHVARLEVVHPSTTLADGSGDVVLCVVRIDTTTADERGERYRGWQLHGDPPYAEWFSLPILGIILHFEQNANYHAHTSLDGAGHKDQVSRPADD